MAESKPEVWKYGKDQFQKYLSEKIKDIKNAKCDQDLKKHDGTSEPDFESDTYKFDNPNRGLAVIFNNELFQNKNYNRPAAVKDEIHLRDALSHLDFNVLVFNNLGAVQMLQAAVKAAACYKHEEADCVVCVINTHGEEIEKRTPNKTDEGKVMEHIVYGSDHEEIETRLIIEQFNDEYCPSLKDKPRLFFIQACRGCKYDDGVPAPNSDAQKQTGTGDTSCGLPLHDPGSLPKDYEDAVCCQQEDSEDPMPFGNLVRPKKKTVQPLKIRQVPLYQDSLIMYATPPGYYAWRRDVGDTGSWFIYELCNFLKRQDIGSKSFLSVLTAVSDAVANYESDTRKKPSHNKKAMPVIDAMLLKLIYMNKK